MANLTASAERALEIIKLRFRSLWISALLWSFLASPEFKFLNCSLFAKLLEQLTVRSRRAHLKWRTDRTIALIFTRAASEAVQCLATKYRAPETDQDDNFFCKTYCWQKNRTIENDSRYINKLSKKSWNLEGIGNMIKENALKIKKVTK